MYLLLHFKAFVCLVLFLADRVCLRAVSTHLELNLRLKKDFCVYCFFLTDFFNLILLLSFRGLKNEKSFLVSETVNFLFKVYEIRSF